MSTLGLAPMTLDVRRRLPEHLALHEEAFADALGSSSRVAVAFSGGVDSSLVLALAVRARGEEGALAVLGVSPSLAAAEREQAHELALLLGVRLVEVQTREISDARYVANGADRCYFCKYELYSRALADVAVAHGAELLVNGDTADDAVRDDRPGQRAAHELGVRAPLAEAGIGKAVVREMAHELGLPVWDKPSAPCLASRIPRNVPVTIGRLRDVEAAEAALRALGMRDLRVRHRGSAALVQLGPVELARLADSHAGGGVHGDVVEVVRRSGFQHVEIDAEPLRRD